MSDNRDEEFSPENIIKDSIFTIRLLQSGNENFTLDRTYFVGTDFKKALYACVMLEKVSSGIAAIDVWKDNEPIPRGTLALNNKESCGSCKYEPECKHDESITMCKLAQEKYDQKQNISNRMTGEKKPEGLTRDTDVSDLLLEAFNAMNKKNI